MKKTVFLSQKKEIQDSDYKYQCPYIFFKNGKWMEDAWYFNDPESFAKHAKTKGYLIS